MKKLLRTLLGLATFVTGALGGHAFGQSNQVVMSFSGQSFASGSNIILTATTPIAHSEIYYYAITGTCHGVGSSLIETIVPAGSTINKALNLVPSEHPITPYLSGTMLDISDKFPFTCLNKLGKGSIEINNAGKFFAGSRVKAGISKDGICFGRITNVKFGFGKRVDKTDSIFFDDGQILVQTVPVTSGTQPDLSYIDATGSLEGVGVINTTGSNQTATVTDLKRGKSKSIVVALQNAGGVADRYTLSATVPETGFTQKFIYKGVNVTAEVTGSTGFIIPPDKRSTPETLGSGEVTTLIWQVTNKAGVSGTSTQLLQATSMLSGSQDAIGITVSGT